MQKNPNNLTQVCQDSMKREYRQALDSFLDTCGWRTLSAEKAVECFVEWADAHDAFGSADEDAKRLASLDVALSEALRELPADLCGMDPFEHLCALVNGDKALHIAALAAKRERIIELVEKLAKRNTPSKPAPADRTLEQAGQEACQLTQAMTTQARRREGGRRMTR